MGPQHRYYVEKMLEEAKTKTNINITEMGKIEISYTDYFEFYALYIILDDGCQEKLTSSHKVANQLLKGMGSQTELPERYDAYILDNICSELKYNCEFNNAMDTS